jgi:hypothetical protein
MAGAAQRLKKELRLNQLLIFKKQKAFLIHLKKKKEQKDIRASGEPAGSDSTGFISTPVSVAIPDIDWNGWPPGREKAIMKRLQLAVEGKENTVKHFWRTSRIIWMAGIMKIEAAAPFIIHLANKADVMQQYAAAWALGRIKSSDAIPLFQSYYKSAQNNLKRIGGEALLQTLKGEELQKHLQHFINSLPDPLKLSVENNNAEQLNELLQERVINQVQPHYQLLEDLYANCCRTQVDKTNIEKYFITASTETKLL